MRHIRIFLLLLTLLIIPQTVSAETPPAVWQPLCVPFKHCGGGAGNENCAPLSKNNPQADLIHTSSHWGHRAQLDFRGLSIPAGQKVILMECIKPDEPARDDNNDGEADWYCTTGFSENDKQFYCAGGSDSASCDVKSYLNQLDRVTYGINGDTVKNRDGASFVLNDTHGFFYKSNSDLNDVNDPFRQADASTELKTDATGKLNVTFGEVQGYTMYAARRKYVVYYVPEVLPTPASRDASGTGGQQQDQLTWRDVTEFQQDECDFGPGWDPYGRVFDSVSLEPIPGVSVSLLQKNPQGAFDAGYAKQRNNLIMNPFMTGSAGDFSFFVEDGDYRLTPVLASYVHPLTKDWTQKGNAAQIYSDFYLNDSPAILQRGAIQHRDIPFIPTDGIGKTYDLVVLSSESKTAANGDLIFQGRVSHPFAEVIVDTCRLNNGVEVCGDRKIFGKLNGGADKEGRFNVTLKQSELQPGEYYKRSFRKINLQTMTSSETESLKGGFALNSIPSYLEGYAYDQDGKLIRGGYVGLYLISMPVPQYVAPIDNNGFYRITSENIPKEPYIIKYLTADGEEYKPTAELRIADYLNQNKEFLTAEQIALYTPVTATTNPRRTVTPEFVPEQQVSPIMTEDQTKDKQATQQAETTEEGERNPMILVAAILLLLVGGAGALLAVYVYKKKAAETEGM
ncbi:hypothetical protein IPM65_02095 [Candidatus Roizmanbacteria bacterium]|nr:MAG: hypothetical protein IPM65_02095 [Candidatus Roizmanbacteria bacterium]